MEEDKEVFVVIVANEDIKIENIEPITVKKEILDVKKELTAPIENIMQLHPPIIKQDYVNQVGAVLPIEFNKNDNKKHKQRYRLIKPSEQVSFVQNLAKQYPDEEKLIEALVEHMKNTKPPPPPLDYYRLDGVDLRCLICDKVSMTIPAAQRHYQFIHGPRYLKCYSCGVDFKSNMNLYKHETRCKGAYAEVVLKARGRYVGRRGKGRPFLYNPPKIKPLKEVIQYTCVECPMTFNSKSGLESHKHHHKGERPYLCTKCPKGYTTNSALRWHYRTHSDEEYICDTCGKAFKLKYVLISHLNTHLPEKRYKCEGCGKRYANRYALTLHINYKHLKLPMPNACQICPKRYPKMSLLKDHMKKVHDMTILTRRNYFHTLPTHSDSMFERAKVISKSEIDRQNQMAMADSLDLDAV